MLRIKELPVLADFRVRFKVCAGLILVVSLKFNNPNCVLLKVLAVSNSPDTIEIESDFSLRNPMREQFTTYSCIGFLKEKSGSISVVSGRLLMSGSSRREQLGLLTLM